jgi:hypothetical protein
VLRSPDTSARLVRDMVKTGRAKRLARIPGALGGYSRAAAATDQRDGNRCSGIRESRIYPTLQQNKGVSVRITHHGDATTMRKRHYSRRDEAYGCSVQL